MSALTGLASGAGGVSGHYSSTAESGGPTSSGGIANPFNIGGINFGTANQSAPAGVQGAPQAPDVATVGLHQDVVTPILIAVAAATIVVLLLRR